MSPMSASAVAFSIWLPTAVLAQGETPVPTDETGQLIQQMIERIDRLEHRIRELESNPTPAPMPSSAVTALPELSEQQRREQERLVRTAFQQTLIERSGLLLPAGTVDLEPSLVYTHSSSDNIVIDGFTVLPVLVVGDIISERIKRNQVTAALTGRIGLPWDSQLDIRIPYSFVEERRFTADNEDTSDSSLGAGDISIGLSHQLIYGQGGSPDILGSLRWKTTSGRGPFDTTPGQPVALGSGYNTLSLAFTAAKVVDPVVYFGGINYGWSLATNESAGRLNPGDSIGLSLGTAIALNLTSSLSFSYDQQFVERSELDGEPIPGTYLTPGTFTVGSAVAVSDTKTADISLGIGVTEDAPDVAFALSMPIRFR